MEDNRLTEARTAAFTLEEDVRDNTCWRSRLVWLSPFTRGEIVSTCCRLGVAMPDAFISGVRLKTFKRDTFEVADTDTVVRRVRSCWTLSREIDKVVISGVRVRACCIRRDDSALVFIRGRRPKLTPGVSRLFGVDLVVGATM